MRDLRLEIKNDKEDLDLEHDTYAMSYKSIHIDTAINPKPEGMDLKVKDRLKAFQHAVMVFLIQMTLIGLVAIYMMGDGFSVKVPPTLPIMITRLICTIMMHL